jgi:predicted RNase H-like HicB family nuclease
MHPFTAYVEWDLATPLYVGTVPGVPGARTQAASLDELRTNRHAVLALCLEEYAGALEDLPRFGGLQ